MTATPEDVRDEAVELLGESFPWIEMLRPEHFEAFLAEYSAAVSQARETGNKEVLEAVLTTWEQTAEIDAKGA